jgi:hypothetical protein
MVTCPKCKRSFALSYGRTFACGGCSSASFGCKYVKCPFCGSEFPESEISGDDISNALG